MRTLFKVLRWFFYFFTIITWVIYIRGEILFSEGNFELIKSIIIPWYLVFCGLMLGYLIATFWVGREKYIDDEVNKERIATRSFLIWAVVWVVFALMYLFI